MKCKNNIYTETTNNNSIKNKYLVVNGKGGHLHGHGHYIHGAVD